MAEQWGQRPDELEATLPARWADRWGALQEARAEAQEKAGQGKGKNLLDE